MHVTYPAFEWYLANDVIYNVSSFLALYPKADGVFKNHIEKIIAPAEKYGKFLRAEYNKAKKKGFTNLQKQPEGKDYRPFVCSDGTWEDIYFNSPVVSVVFWLKGKPKPNPLDYLISMVWGRISKKPDGISLLDYQYFLIACIYDSQLHAGQRQIYFSPKPKDSALWDKELKDRICRRVWDVLVKGQRETITETNIVKNNIEKAVETIEADLQATSGKDDSLLPKTAETATLVSFMQKYCNCERDCDIESKKALLYKHNLKVKGKIKLPKLAQKWTQGQTKIFYVADLLRNWPTWCMVFPTLPRLKNPQM